MTKKVEEMKFKFYQTHLDSVLDENYIIHSIDVEDNNIPQSIDLTLDVASLPDRLRKYSGEGYFRLKSATRISDEGTNYIEKFYLRVT